MRAGPLGFFDFETFAFHILKTPFSRPNRFLRGQENGKHSLQARKTEAARTGIRGWQPSFGKMPSVTDYSIDPCIVNWNDYDAVFVINDSIPRSVRRNYPDTLFVVIPEDGIIPYRFFGYDAITTQSTQCLGIRSSRLINMPWTFVGPFTIQKALESLNISTNSPKSGLFLEINQFSSRPPTQSEAVALYGDALKSQFGFNLHQDYIVDNLASIARSLFFVKITGRPIRGNSLYEAVSAGCPVLVNPNLIIDCFPLPPSSFVYSYASLQNLLNRQDVLTFRDNLLSQQRLLLSTYGYQFSLNQLAAIGKHKTQERQKNVLFRFLAKTKRSLRLLFYYFSLPIFYEDVDWN